MVQKVQPGQTVPGLMEVFQIPLKASQKGTFTVLEEGRKRHPGKSFRKGGIRGVEIGGGGKKGGNEGQSFREMELR